MSGFLQSLKKLRNRYFALRHGRSKAQEAGIIVSAPLEGAKEQYALSAHGEGEVWDLRKSFAAAALFGEDVAIYSSPFSRAIQTAAIVKTLLCATRNITVDARLRERFFGDWEGTSTKNYRITWEKDQVDPAHTDGGVESAVAVQARMVSLIAEIEKRCARKAVLLVSHGDPLIMLQAAFEGAPLSSYYTLKRLRTAEFREFALLCA